MSLTIVRSTNQVFCRMPSDWGFSDVFLIIRLGLWVLGRKTTEVKYSWPLNNTVWIQAHSYMECFSINILLALRIPGSCVRRVKQPQIKTSIFRNARIQKAYCLHSLFCTFLYKDLSIHRCWYPWGVLEPIFRGYWGTNAVKFGGNQKLYMDFRLCRGQRP